MRLGQGAGWLLLLSLLAAVPLATARADSIVWTERNNGDLTTLAYGPLDPAKAPIFLLSCFNEMEIAVLNVHHEIDGKEGDAITIELSSAKAQAPVAAEIAKNRETGNTYGEASDIKVKPILKVLRDPGPITLTIGKMEVTLSEAGREQAAADFAKACKLN
jgi:hypothetical protein